MMCKRLRDGVLCPVCIVGSFAKKRYAKEDTE